MLIVYGIAAFCFAFIWAWILGLGTWVAAWVYKRGTKKQRELFRKVEPYVLYSMASVFAGVMMFRMWLNKPFLQGLWQCNP